VLILELLANYRLGTENLFITTTLERHTQLEKQRLRKVREDGCVGWLCSFFLGWWNLFNSQENYYTTHLGPVDVLFLYIFFLFYFLFFSFNFFTFFHFFFLACLRSWVCLKFYVLSFIRCRYTLPQFPGFVQLFTCLQLRLGLSLGSVLTNILINGF